MPLRHFLDGIIHHFPVTAFTELPEYGWEVGYMYNAWENISVFESNIERELVYVFRTIYDGVINPSAEELDGGRFWSKEDIAACIGKGVFTPNFEGEYQRFFV